MPVDGRTVDRFLSHSIVDAQTLLRAGENVADDGFSLSQSRQMSNEGPVTREKDLLLVLWFFIRIMIFYTITVMINI